MCRERGRLIFTGTKSRRKITRLADCERALRTYIDIKREAHGKTESDEWRAVVAPLQSAVNEVPRETAGNKGSHSISQRAPVRRFKRSYKFRLFLARSARINRTGHNAFTSRRLSRSIAVAFSPHVRVVCISRGYTG